MEFPLPTLSKYNLYTSNQCKRRLCKSWSAVWNWTPAVNCTFRHNSKVLRLKMPGNNAHVDVHAAGPSNDPLIWNGAYALLCKKGTTPLTIHLTTSTLQLHRKKSIESFQFDEIASCRVTPSEELTPKSSRCLRDSKEPIILESDVCLQLVLYPRKNNSRHRRRVITLVINTHSDYEDNLNEAKLFQSKISSLIHTGKDNRRLVEEVNWLFSPHHLSIRSREHQTCANHPQSQEWKGQYDKDIWPEGETHFGGLSD